VDEAYPSAGDFDGAEQRRIVERFKLEVNFSVGGRRNVLKGSTSAVLGPTSLITSIHGAPLAVDPR
jgi:hypothetical protein